MVIDFHVHCFPDDLAKRAVPALAECAGIKNFLDGTLNSIRNSMIKAGIDKSVILSIATKPSQTERINSWSAEIQTDSIISFGSIHPDYPDWKSELDRIKDLGLKGIKFHPEYQDFYVDDENMLKIYEYAIKLGLIIVFHAGVDLGFKGPFHCTPDRLRRVVEIFPDGKIIAAHMGGFRFWDEVEEYLVGENIYLDTSYCIGMVEDAQLRRIIRNHGYEKIIFATDSPWKDQRVEINKFHGLGFEDVVENSILGENARNLLGII